MGRSQVRCDDRGVTSLAAEASRRFASTLQSWATTISYG